MTQNVTTELLREKLRVGTRRTQDMNLDLYVEPETADLPILSRVRMDGTAHLRKLTVIDGKVDTTDHTQKYIGFTRSREQLGYSKSAWNAADGRTANEVLAPLTGALYNRTLIPPAGRQAMKLKIGSSQVDFTSIYETPQLGYHTGYAVGLHKTAETMSKKDLLQMWLFGEVVKQGQSQAKFLTVVPKPTQDGNANFPNVFNLCTGHAPWQNEDAEATLERLALTMVPSTATNALKMLGPALETLAGKANRFQGALRSMFMKSQGDFVELESDEEVFAMAQLMILGRALVEEGFEDNLIVPSSINMQDSDSVAICDGTLTGSAEKPLYDLANARLHVIDEGHISMWCLRGSIASKDGSKRFRTFKPYWLAGQTDLSKVKRTAPSIISDKDADRYMEYFLTGLETLLEAASLETGMIVRSMADMHLDTYSEMDSAKVEDFATSERTDMVALIQASAMGYRKLADYHDGVEAATTAAKLNHFQDIITDGSININHVEQHTMEMRELASRTIKTGGRVTEGAALLGEIHADDVVHRRTQDGMVTTSTTIKLRGAPRAVKFTVSKFDSADPADGTALTSLDMVLWQSTPWGWHCEAAGVRHPIDHSIPHVAGTHDIQVMGHGRGYGGFRIGKVARSPASGSDGFDIYPEAFYRKSPLTSMVIGDQLQTSQLYKLADHFATAIPFKSKLDAYSPATLDMMYELKMRSPVSLVSDTIDMILNGPTYCTNTGRLKLRTRLIERHLTDPDFHKKFEDFDDGFNGMDSLLYLIPKGCDANKFVQSLAAGNFLAMQLGTIGRMYIPNDASILTLAPAAMLYSEEDDVLYNFNSAGLHWDSYPICSSGGAAVRGTNVQTIFIGKQTIDAAIQEYHITGLGDSVSGRAANGLGATQQFYDFMDEALSNSHAAADVRKNWPGMRYRYEVLALAPADHICEVLGTTDVPAGYDATTGMGSKIPAVGGVAMLGWRGEATLLTAQDTLGAGKSLTKHNIRRFLEKMRNDRLWLEGGSSMIEFDQDALDLDESLFGALIGFNGTNVISPYITQLAIYGAGGELEGEISSHIEDISISVASNKMKGDSADMTEGSVDEASSATYGE
uniref:Uncharacterized protein n=1 Tax=viral metagenome TaxID=1070528 RepID=A0A2V0RJ06_9ZZZZ